MTYLSPSYLGQYSVGDILNVDFQGAGRAMQGDHPGILAGVDTDTKMATVIPITSTQDWAKYPKTMKIKKHTVNGLANDSVALIFQVTVTDPRFIRGKRGCLNADELNLMKSILRLHFQI